MPTVRGRRCPRCGGPVKSELQAQVPLHKSHSEVTLDSCTKKECGWASGKRIPDKPEAAAGAALEDVEN